VNGTLFFVGRDEACAELWKSDGTAAGTVRVKDINPGIGCAIINNADALTNVNDALFFSANDGTDGAQLWTSDGTSAGTVQVTEPVTGAASASPTELTNSNGTLLFAADDGVSGSELWKSDGTEAGTALVKDIRAGATGSSPSRLTTSNGTVFFGADSGAGRRLWKSDGTGAGTVQVSSIAIPAFPWFADMNGTLFFSTGPDLWKSDGTEAGTVLVEENFSPSEPGFAPGGLAFDVVGSRIVYQGVDASGQEPWTSDGTAAGTHRVANIGAIGGSVPSLFTEVGSRVFFVAQTDDVGRELFAVPIAALADGDQDGLDDADEVAQNTNPDDPDSDDDGLTDGAEVLTHGTHPLDPDTDDDGHSDFDEIQDGTDPLDPLDPPSVPLAAPWALAAAAALLLAAARSRRGLTRS